MSLETTIAFLLSAALITLGLCWLDYVWRKRRIAEWDRKVREFDEKTRKWRDVK